MILYNVTVKIDHSVHDEWLSWMQTKHIPDVINTGIFQDFRICRILDENEPDCDTYSIQYKCKTIEDYKKYQKEFAPKLQSEHTQKFKDKFVAYRTVMQVVAESRQ